jgi:hypothetical protein
VQRFAAVPGFGVDSAQQIIAEVGATAMTFPAAKRLASWVGACPGHDESAGINHSHRAPSGNRQMRRLLNQAAHAAVKTKGSIFELLYRRFVVRLGHPRRSAQLRIGCVGCCGRPCTTGSRTRNAGRHQSARTTSSRQDDPRTPQSRLSRRTSTCSFEQSGMIAGDFSTLSCIIGRS